jgi:hypothetical protein
MFAGQAVWPYRLVGAWEFFRENGMNSANELGAARARASRSRHPRHLEPGTPVAVCTIGPGHPEERAMTLAAFDKADQLIALALGGGLAKDALARTLSPGSRQAFLAACARIERRYTDACASTHDACLESGCSCEDEVCLQPLLRADADVRKAYGAAWMALFADPANRDPFWTLPD